MDRSSCSYFYSCHPTHTKRSIPYTLARIICTIVSIPEIRDLRLLELRKSLLTRNYPTTLINGGIEKAKKIPRNDLLKTKDKTNIQQNLPYISTHNPQNPKAFNIINDNILFLTSDSKMKEIIKQTKFIKSKRQPPNLKHLLTKAKFTSQPSTKEGNKVTKCK